MEKRKHMKKVIIVVIACMISTTLKAQDKVAAALKKIELIQQGKVQVKPVTSSDRKQKCAVCGRKGNHLNLNLPKE
jgi:hypothetical protein